MRNKGKRCSRLSGSIFEVNGSKALQKTTKPAECLHEHHNQVSIKTGSEEIENKQYAKDAHDGGERIL